MSNEMHNVQNALLPKNNEEERREAPVKEPNSKPHWMNKIAAGIIDGCLIFLAYVGLYNLFKLTPMGTTLDNYYTEVVERMDYFKLLPLVTGSEETYGYKAYEGSEDYKKYETNSSYIKYNDEYGKYVILAYPNATDAIKKAYANKINTDTTISNARFNYQFVDYGLTMLSVSISELVIIFLIPLFNKRSASPGKLVNNMQMISFKYHERCKWYQLLGRFLFSLLIGTALPYLWIGNWTVLLTPGIYFLVSAISKDGRSIHDYINRTLVIDKTTYVPLLEEAPEVEAVVKDHPESEEDK